MGRVHVPDGFLDAPTSLATAAVAAGAVAVALNRARAELDERAAPMAGLTAGFVLAAQMINFPVGAGTSGHLLGGALAAVLVGPWTAMLCLTVVLLVQALLFADGGLTALGTNVTLLAVITVLVGWAATRTALAVLPRRSASVVPASFVGALVSVPVAALAFVALYELGGVAPVPLGALTAAMLGWHTLIGLVEALITAATVSAVVAVRPDLVRAADRLRPVLHLRTGDGLVEVPQQAPVRRGLAAVPLAVSLMLAGLVAAYASSSPDGLERVAADVGFLDRARASLTAASPLRDYAVSGVGDARLAVGLAGVAGVLVTVLLARSLVGAARLRRASPEQLPLDRV